MTPKNRHLARTVALQALYELDSTGHRVGDVLMARLEEQPEADDIREFVYRLVNGVLEYRARLDTVITRYAPEWPLDQMAVIDRNILRMAIYEFAVWGETPVRVVINEAIELAKYFGAESTARFVNGVLGALAPKETELQAALVQK